MIKTVIDKNTTKFELKKEVKKVVKQNKNEEKINEQY